MELTGEYRIRAPRERVWAMLNDAEVLRACIPGCETLEGDPERGFAARVTTKVGPVKATFNGAVTLSNVNPPESYTIGGEGKGGVAGFAKGGADVRLVENEGETLLTYTANAQVGGKLAQLGSRLIDSTAKKLANEFFACFAERASAAEPSAPVAEPSASMASAEPEPIRLVPEAGGPLADTAALDAPANPVFSTAPAPSPAAAPRGSGSINWPIILGGVAVVLALLYAVLS